MPFRDTPLPATRLVVKVSQLIRLLTLHSGESIFYYSAKLQYELADCKFRTSKAVNYRIFNSKLICVDEILAFITIKF